MPKKKNKKKNKKETKGQLGKKKETAREKMIGQTIGYRYDVNLLPDYSRITPFLKKYVFPFLYCKAASNLFGIPSQFETGLG